METSKILKWWHYLSIGAAGVSAVASQVQPLVASYPKASAICLGVSAASLATTTIMNKIASDKIVQAVINDPSSPTPQGFGIPQPQASALDPSIKAAPDTQTAALLAAAKNAAEFSAVLSSQK